jgi:peptide/nickel transport system substrate-binding protein
VLALAAGCGQGAAPASAAPTSVTLVGGIQSEPNWWFPIVPEAFNGTNNDGIGLMYRPLVWIANNGTIDFSRSIASRITVSRDDTVYTVTMNPKWHWSDGRPVSAADAVFGWQLYNATNQPNAPWNNAAMGSRSLDALKSVVALGPLTIRLTLNRPYNPIWAELDVLNYASPIPRFVWDRYHNMTQELKWIYAMGNKPLAPEFRVVDGPYDVTRFVSDEYWVMQANPRYDGHKPQIKTLVYEYETSDDNVFVGLRKGVFATANLPTAFYGSAKQLTQYRIATNGYDFSFNIIQPDFSPNSQTVGGLFNKLYIRQAMQMGIDEPLIAKVFYDGFAVPDYTVVARLPANRFYDPNLPVYYPFNPEAGKRLLERHGWHEVNGVMEKNGQKLAFNFIYMSGSTTDQHIVEYLQHTWAEEGIDVTLVPMPFNQILAITATTATANKWALVYWGAGWYGGLGYPSLSLFETGSAYNSEDYSNLHLDTLIKAALAPGTPEEALARLYAYETYAAQQLPALFLPEYIGVGNPAPYHAVKPWLHGVGRYHEPVAGGSEPWRWTTAAVR